MNKICNKDVCTGCGMCTNLCPVGAISLKVGYNNFLYPDIDKKKCIDCGLCEKKCPVNIKTRNQKNIISTYAVWCKDKNIRKTSTSGGMFTVLADRIIEKGGIVVGCIWTEDFETKHEIIDKKEDLVKLRGSKYVQSETGTIYKRVKQELDKGRLVLFSGTPCQNHALSIYCGKEYSNLIQVDMVCHGVPSAHMWSKYINEINGERKKIVNVFMRYKEKYWDYTFMKVEYEDGTYYKKRTIDDAYFNLFNVGYSLRESCHHCNYANVYRYGDITLADYWGFKLKSFKMRDYQKGTSLVLVNSEKGKKLFSEVEKNLVLEKGSLDDAIKGNKCLKEPFCLPTNKVKLFWNDYNNGASIENLNKKYSENMFKLPRLLFLRRIYHKWMWVLKK